MAREFNFKTFFIFIPPPPRLWSVAMDIKIICKISIIVKLQMSGHPAIHHIFLHVQVATKCLRDCGKSNGYCLPAGWWADKSPPRKHHQPWVLLTIMGTWSSRHFGESRNSSGDWRMFYHSWCRGQNATMCGFITIAIEFGEFGRQLNRNTNCRDQSWGSKGDCHPGTVWVVWQIAEINHFSCLKLILIN